MSDAQEQARLQQRVSHWPTRVGKAYLGKQVFLHGHDIHYDLSGMDWFEYHLFAITGRRFSASQLELLNWIWSSTSYPDPSIWPNHTTALGASVRTTSTLALCAGLVSSEATLFGGRPLKRAHGFFRRLYEAIARGGRLSDFVEQEIRQSGVIFGYGRPLSAIDERVVPTWEKIKALGFDQGPHIKLAWEVKTYMADNRGLGMNIVALDAAIGADFGLSSEEFHQFMMLCFYAGQPPCYSEALRQPEGHFFPVRCDDNVYDGPAIRCWQTDTD